jgi:hypothetical protein
MKNIIRKIRLKRAIKKANRLYNQTGYQYLVLLYRNKFIVKSRKEIKELVRLKYFGCSLQTIERIAIYKTFHTRRTYGQGLPSLRLPNS